MEEKNCLDCLYANYDEFGLLFGKYLDDDYRKCEHSNSPYFEQIVGSKYICRLFTDEKEYFRNKELREKIIHLKNKK
jgi:hypothetical protein